MCCVPQDGWIEYHRQARFASDLISPLSSTDLVKAFEAKHINFDKKYYPEDACSLQPTIGASGEYASLLVIRKYQESIGQDLGTKSAHGMNPDSSVMPHISMRIKLIDDSQCVPPEELRRTRQETEDVKENRPKGLIIVDIELVAVKLHKSPGSSGWNGWQSIVMETEYGDAWVDKADENSQRLETYDAMPKTTESEREAKNQITEQANKYARNGGRRYREPCESLSKIESVELKVENEMLSVQMRLMKAIGWNQAKFGDDAAEKHVSDDAQEGTRRNHTIIEQVIPDLRNTQNAKEGASSQRRARSAGEAPGAHQREREG